MLVSRSTQSTLLNIFSGDMQWFLLVLPVAFSTLFTINVNASTSNQRVKRLAQVVCEAGSTKIIAPHYYRENAAGWCADAVGELANDFKNLAYRTECQRWLGGPLPDSVTAAQLEYCYDYMNGTVTYNMGICCLGTTTALRCFTGEHSLLWRPESFYSGNINYRINYEHELTTCGVDEVCQTRYTYYGSDGAVNNLTFSKSCAARSQCEAIANGDTCSSCTVAVPECVQCCDTAFCNLGFQTYGDYWQGLRPTVCPTQPPPPPCYSSPCLNGGICWNIDAQNFSCHCRIQWRGHTCNESRTECVFANPCFNGGTCYDYSDIAVGDYRCACVPPYVGDNCEISSNLTCNSSDAMYSKSGESYKPGNCTQLTWTAFGHPEVAYTPQYFDFVSLCHSSGPEPAYRIYFEMQHCERGDYYSWTTYNSCCSNRTQCTFANPCLNGGTCYDWSDVGPGEYRCACPPLFNGEDCEIPSNLTCSSSDLMYLTTSENYYYTQSWNCTERVWAANGNPYRDMLNWYCLSYIRRPSDGHQFQQGVDGQIVSSMVQFEMMSCAPGEIFSWSSYHMCCPSCLSSPCQNDGYCIQITYNQYKCKCLFGFGGKYCELKLAMCAVTGDPHYRTFDGKLFDYQGQCKYILAATCNPQPDMDSFFVSARNEPRGDTSVVSYPWYVDIIINGNTTGTIQTRLMKNVDNDTAQPITAFVNGWRVKIPFYFDTFGIYYNGDFAHFEAPELGLKVDVDPDWVIVVSVPTTFNGSVCGLCGDADGDANNDLMLPDGTPAQNATEFGDSWVIPDIELILNGVTTCPGSSFQPATPPKGGGNKPIVRKRRAAEPVCQPLQEYRDKCAIINNTNNVFGRCIPKLGAGVADQHYADCLLDACYSDGASICKSIRAFAFDCRIVSAQIPCGTWKTSSGCDDSELCSAGMIYQCSVPACRATCADPKAPDQCPLPNTDGCVCPTGQLLHDGECVSECPVGCIGPMQQFIPVGDNLPGPNCTTILCNYECENCTDVLMETYNGCLTGYRCVNRTCTPTPTTTPRDHDNRKSTPPGQIDKTHVPPGHDKTTTTIATANTTNSVDKIPPGQQKTNTPPGQGARDKTTKKPTNVNSGNGIGKGGKGKGKGNGNVGGKSNGNNKNGKGMKTRRRKGKKAK